MITLVGVSVRYPNAVPLEAVSAVIDDFPAVLVGPSGSGKSSLLRVIAGIQAPDEGVVEIDGEPVERPSWRSAGDPRVSVVHQDYRLVPFLSVAENAVLAAELRGRSPSRAEVVASLGVVGLDPTFLDRVPATLSGGEQQRVAIARAMLAGVELILADEPTGALDAGNTQRVAEALLEVASSGVADVVIATHDPVVAGLVPSRLTLQDGSLCTSR